LNGTITGPNVLTVTGMLVWSGGSMTGTGKTVVSGSTTLGGNVFASMILDTRSFENDGSVTFNGGNLSLFNGALFKNVGTFTAAGTAQSVGTSFQNPGQFANTGSVTVNNGSGFSVGAAFNNEGTLSVQTNASASLST